MLSVGTRKLLFWLTIITLVGSALSLVRKTVCADVDPRMYIGLFALGPAVLVADAVTSIARRRARDFWHRGLYAEGIKQVSVYDVSEVTGPAAVSLGRTRLILPGLALLAFIAFALLYDPSGIPRC